MGEIILTEGEENCVNNIVGELFFHVRKGTLTHGMGKGVFQRNCIHEIDCHWSDRGCIDISMSEYVSEINTNMLLILFAVVNKITAKHSVHVSLSFPSWEELNANRSQPPPPDTFWMEALASQGEPEQVTEEDWKE